MFNYAEGLQRALAYIEENLAGDVQVEEAARRAYVSAFHFQRIFHALCGVTLGEYVRLRRLTLAAHELSKGEAKVIDVALKYGYDSPDSFARAFARFHGLPPSAAKERGAKLNAFSPMSIKLVLEGGSMLEYKIVEKAPFTVMGVSRGFNSDTSYQKIPKYWDEYLAGANRPVCGKFGVCLDGDGKEFEYMIADLYQPWQEVPQGCKTHAFPASTWAVFPCRMDNLQDVNTRMWKEWLPNCREYRLAGSYNLEVYWPPEENRVELWLPVEKA